MTDDLRARLQDALGDAFQIQKELGGGGMSRLFLAEEASLHRQVVIKVLPPEYASDVSAARFQREIETAAHLSHPHILPVLTAGAHGDLLYYVMPFVPGESLRHRLIREGKLPLADAVPILREVADALAFAHAAGVLHRDIKPENILLQSGHATLTDFGVARAIAESRSGARLTDTGMVVGTPGYMSPEQVAGERSLDARADVYALAVVAYEMLAGEPPFQGPTAQAVLAAHLMETPRALTEVRPEVPRAVSAVIARALAKDPHARLRTAAEFRDALAGASIGGRGGLSRNARLGAAVGVVLVVAVAGYFGLRGGTPTALDTNVIAVAPFDVVGEGLLQWREGLVDLLARQLDGAGPLRTVSPTLTIKRWTGRADPSSATALGQSVGAGLTVFGQLVAARGDSVRLTASVMDVGSGKTLGQVDLRGPADDVERLTDSVSVGLLAELGRTRQVGAARLTSLGTKSLPALRAFLQGEQWYRRAQWDSALTAYENALTLDTAFGLAYHRQAQVIGWIGSGGDYARAALTAGAHNVGLAPRESLALVLDSIAGGSGEPPPGLLGRYLSTVNESVRRYPDAESWLALGEYRYHFAAGPYAATPEEALEAFESAVAFDSTFGPVYEHLVHLSLALRPLDLAVHRVHAWRALVPGADERQALDFFLRLTSPGAERVPHAALRASLDSLSPDVLGQLVFVVRDWPDTSPVVVTILEELAAARRARRQYQRASTAGLMVHASVRLMQRGLLREGIHGLSFNGRNGAEVMLAGGLPGDSLERVLRRWLSEGSLWTSAGLWWWAEQGEPAPIEAFHQLAASQKRTATDPGVRAVWERLDAATPAYRALARRDTTGALAALAALPDSLAPDWTLFDRFTQARLLYARHADQAAAAVLERYPKPIDDQWPSRVLWALLRARVRERLGAADLARQDYAYVEGMWRFADPELQPYREEALAGLARLSATDRPSN